MIFAQLGENCEVQENVKIGVKHDTDVKKTKIGKNSTIRSGTIIYADVEIGENLNTGHNALIRENTEIGNEVLVGTNVVIEGNVKIGNKVKLETNSYIPTNVKLGNRVFLGPGATLTNDKYPLRKRNEYEPNGPILENDVTVGARAVILPGIKVGKGSIIGAGSVVTEDLPSWSMAKGNPAEISPLPEDLRERNKA